MALINCNECGNQISSKAEACPKCGAPVGDCGAFGGFRKGVTTRPDFWHDRNVGAIGVFIAFIIGLILFCWLAKS